MAKPKADVRPKKAAPKQAPKPTPEPATKGRPSSFKPEYTEQAVKLCRLGATDKEVADFFEVSEQTLNAWKKAHPAFLESLKRGKRVADAEVASKLFSRATGYEHPEDDIKAIAGEIVITPTIKHYPPDTTAAIFWLKNRRPDLWRDKVEQSHTGPDGGPIRARIAIEHVKPPPRVDDDA